MLSHTPTKGHAAHSPKLLGMTRKQRRYLINITLIVGAVVGAVTIGLGLVTLGVWLVITKLEFVLFGLKILLPTALVSYVVTVILDYIEGEGPLSYWVDRGVTNEL